VKKLTAAAMAVMISIALGCNGESKDDKRSDYSVPGAVEPKPDGDKKAEVKKPTKPWDPALGTATVKGQVKFNGKAPKRRPIDMAGKPECAACQKDKTLDESIIVNADGFMQNVFVYVRSGVEEYVFPVPKEAVFLDQNCCKFTPHVVGVRVGQPLKIRNSDGFSHNVRSTPRSVKNRAFNFMQTTQGKEDIVEFHALDVFVKLKCDLHGWMGANVGVVENPYFAITDADGRFEIKNLPKGEFTIEARHEELGSKTVNVKLADKESKDISFEFEKSKE